MSKKEKSGVIKTITNIDKIIHEPTRLMILSYLYIAQSADFIFLKSQLNLTDGNLSSHISKLEEAGYVDVKKKFVGKKPHTMYKLTEKGRNSFKEYRKKIKRLLDNIPD
jgi:DNA-binding transcriptional ArsR family regulator